AWTDSGLTIVALLGFVWIDEVLETLAHHLQEFGRAREVPVRVGDLGVAHVGRQRKHVLVHILALLMPAQQATHRKAVAQIVDAGRTVAAASDPAQFPAQLVEDTVGLPITERETEPADTGGDEEQSPRYRR